MRMTVRCLLSSVEQSVRDLPEVRSPQWSATLSTNLGGAKMHSFDQSLSAHTHWLCVPNPD